MKYQDIMKNRRRRMIKIDSEPLILENRRSGYICPAGHEFEVDKVTTDTRRICT